MSSINDLGLVWCRSWVHLVVPNAQSCVNKSVGPPHTLGFSEYIFGAENFNTSTVRPVLCDWISYRVPRSQCSKKITHINLRGNECVFEEWDQSPFLVFSSFPAFHSLAHMGSTNKRKRHPSFGWYLENRFTESCTGFAAYISSTEIR